APSDSAPPPSSRFAWEETRSALVSGAAGWMSSSSRRQVEGLRDEQDDEIPLWGDLWLTLYPAKYGAGWRCEAEAMGAELAGRGATPDLAVQDWRKRFNMTLQRYLEMRPFEMTDADSEQWGRIRAVVDVPRYRAMKPIVIRQVGELVKN